MKKNMNNFLQKMIFGGVGLSLLIACSAESVNDKGIALNATTNTSTNQELSMDDLAGRWNMYAMTSVETTVDFDQDGNRTNDLLLETDCFDPMYFDFSSTGEVATYQSRLFFSEVTGAFSCQTTGNYVATYMINSDQLSVTFTVDGQTYTETKSISRYSENGSEFLKVTLTKTETNTAVYVAKDPGNTVASDIKQIDMIYKKE